MKANLDAHWVGNLKLRQCFSKFEIFVCQKKEQLKFGTGGVEHKMYLRYCTATSAAHQSSVSSFMFAGGI